MTQAAMPLRNLARHNGLRAMGRLPGPVEYGRELWAHRHFVTAFAGARVTASLGGTRLGAAWELLTPLINAGIYFLIFGVVLGARHSTPHFVAYLCIGVFVFGFTQSVVQAGVRAISGNLGLVRALNFPRAALPVGITLTEARNMVVSAAVLVAIVLAGGVPAGPGWLLLAPAILLQSVFNAGLALLVARLGAQLEDLRRLTPFVLRIWMYGSAVLYPVTFLTDHLHGRLRHLAEANPMLVFIDLTRHTLLPGVPLVAPAWRLWTEATAWALLVGAAGYAYFRRGESEYGRG
ncbi:ABC transporter permease [Paractinoplanes ferrugineus]|uniref:Transport permease protein n=1 Tax=Paractinoplanes ferrugineus TaxID=113564 RepID=A0A919J5W0_9ACTN|nr:ABC transporter permease [Actinoplanes ferrugineus]GIE15055.1 transport permease protein [Actinoplanes ferrugineus]